MKTQDFPKRLSSIHFKNYKFDVLSFHLNASIRYATYNNVSGLLLPPHEMCGKTFGQDGHILAEIWNFVLDKFIVSEYVENIFSKEVVAYERWITTP